MSGIDKIISQIESDTRAVCDDVVNKAQMKSERIITEAVDKAAAIKADSEKAIAARSADIVKRGESAASLEEMKILLSSKQNIISTMLSHGIDRLKSLPDSEYFDLILRMVKKYSLKEDGIIRFGKKDIARLPVNFINDIDSAANGRLTLSDEAADIDAGFILIYGGIEENCSFDAIFTGEEENLRDRASKLLF